MPQELRKRGKRGQKRQHEEVEIEKPRLPKPRLPSPIPLERSGDEPVQEEDQSLWPKLDPDTRAYFKQIEERILEFSALPPSTSQHGQDDDLDDERALLLKSSLSALTPHEIPLATDPETSIIFERLIHSMNAFALRVLLDRFAGNFTGLSNDRYGSHIIQTLLIKSSEALMSKSAGLSKSNQKSTLVEQANEESITLPTLVELLLAAFRELETELASLLYDSYGSHVLLTSLRILCGKSLETENSRRASDAYRSKKSKKFKTYQAPMKSLLPIETGSTKGKAVVPFEFEVLLDSILAKLNKSLAEGDEIRQLAVHESGTLVLQLLLEIEYDRSQTSNPDSIMNRLLENLITSLSENSQYTTPRSDFVEGLLRDSTSSHVLETVLRFVPMNVLTWLWIHYFHGRLDRLSAHPSANFVLAKAIERLETKQFGEALKELGESSSATEMIAKSKTGILRALLDRAPKLQIDCTPLLQMLNKALEVESESPYLVLCGLSLVPFSMYKKSSDYLSFSDVPEFTVQGSLLLQSWAALPSPHNISLQNSLLAFPLPMLVKVCTNITSGYLVIAILTSPSTTPQQKRKLLQRLIGQYHLLADDKAGSLVADKCWEVADVYLKEKIAASLLPQSLFLRGSHFGQYFLRRINLPLFERRPQEWKDKLTTTSVNQTQDQKLVRVSRPEKVKKQKAERDEIDEIFG